MGHYRPLINRYPVRDRILDAVDIAFDWLDRPSKLLTLIAIVAVLADITYHAVRG